MTLESNAIWRGIDVSFQNWESFENWHEKFDKFWPEHSKVSNIFTLMGFFWAKYNLFELKKIKGVIFHDTESDYKIWRGTDLPFQNSHEHSKVSKIFTLMGSFWAKHKFELKKQRGVIFYDTEESCKICRGIDLSFRNWQIWQILTQALKSVKNFHFNGLLLSKLYIVWARKAQKSYLLWHWRVMKNLKRNWLVVSKVTWGIWQILTWITWKSQIFAL